jgi:putative transposase
VFDLLLVVDLPDRPLMDVDGVLGVDLGIKNIACDSIGGNFSGEQLNGIRNRYFRLRKKLQKKETKSAKHLLKKLRRKEKRFATDVNHQISKKMVDKAFRHNLALALEDLKGIREKTTVKKAQRRQHHSWVFYPLRQSIQYKAQKAGVPVFLVDPRNTSRTCPQCRQVDKKNRKTRDWFHCQSCDFASPADNVAACNIASRAVVNLPNAVIS